jgi:hypothetical protein
MNVVQNVPIVQAVPIVFGNGWNVLDNVNVLRL